MKNFFKSIGIINIIIIIILVNVLLALSISPRIDLTKNKIHSLSPVSKKIVKDLDDVVNIKVFVSNDLPNDIKPIKNNLVSLLGEYEKLNKRKIKISFLDPTNNSEIEAEIEKFGIQKLQFSTINNDKLEVSNGYFGLAILYGNKKDVLPVIKDVQNLEYYINSAIKRITTTKIPTVALFENSNNPSELNYFKQFLNNSYKIDNINLNTDEISDEVETLIIVDNKNKLEEKTIVKIKKLIEKNKSLLVFVNKVDIEPNMTGKLLPNTGIEQILKENGMEIEDTLILDKNAAIANFQTNGGTFSVEYPYWIKIVPENFNKNVPAIAGISSVTFPWVSSIKINENATALVKSSKDSFANQDLTNLLPTNQQIPIGYEKKPLVVAAMSNKSKIGVVADSDFFKDQFFMQNKQNMILALSLVDNFSQDDSLASIRSKTITSNPIKQIDNNLKNIFKWVNIILPIFILTMIGLIFNLIRKNRNKHINE